MRTTILDHAHCPDGQAPEASCHPCEDTRLRLRETPLDETMRQMQRCEGWQARTG